MVWTPRGKQAPALSSENSDSYGSYQSLPRPLAQIEGKAAILRFSGAPPSYRVGRYEEEVVEKDRPGLEQGRAYKNQTCNGLRRKLGT